MKLSSAFAKIATQLRLFDELAREIDHPGEAGAAREAALRNLLLRYLPQRAGVGSGFVMDASGGVSRQVDLVVYDRGAATVFDISGVEFFACETVIAVGEVKARIDSRETLEDALGNIASVKSLDRSNKGTNLPITGAGYSMSPPFVFDPAHKHRDQIFGFIFTGNSLSEEGLVAALRDWNGSHPRAVWPNLYCDHNRFIASYEAEQLTTSAMDAQNLYVTAPEERENLLLLFIAMLATFVNEAHVARPDLFAYAGISETKHRDYPLT
jgi:hypothetical protein